MGDHREGFQASGRNRKATQNPISEWFRIPAEERWFLDKKVFCLDGKTAEEQICDDVMRCTRTKVEMSSNQEQALTIFISGQKEDDVKARRELDSALRAPVKLNIRVHKDYHKYLVGKMGSKLKELEKSTATSIVVPRVQENSDTISLVGTREGVNKAKHAIELIANKQTGCDNLVTENIPVPFHFHRLFKEEGRIEDLMRDNNVSIQFPVDREDYVIVAGASPSVEKVKQVILTKVARLNEQQASKLRVKYKTTVEVESKYRPVIIGVRARNIDELRRKHGVEIHISEHPGSTAQSTVTIVGCETSAEAAKTEIIKMVDDYIMLRQDEMNSNMGSRSINHKPRRSSEHCGRLRHQVAKQTFQLDAQLLPLNDFNQVAPRPDLRKTKAEMKPVARQKISVRNDNDITRPTVDVGDGTKTQHSMPMVVDDKVLTRQDLHTYLSNAMSKELAEFILAKDLELVTPTAPEMPSSEETSSSVQMTSFDRSRPVETNAQLQSSLPNTNQLRDDTILQNAAETIAASVPSDTDLPDLFTFDLSLTEHMDDAEFALYLEQIRMQHFTRQPTNCALQSNSSVGSQSKPERSSSLNESDEPSCPICLETFNQLKLQSQGSVSSLKCGHLFCGDCLNDVMDSTRLCPTCRAPIQAQDIRPVFF